ncbi:Pyridine nucleotide-disulphide oxidoreductase [Acididesulfobacillus acetoxydans]|uniref:FAD-dependent pyridine nucleotide-disulfide oxidoreductase n=1 Tax=Acididesulfobacillus acetoxydans TaxID=1561005 RepID=A0A8S0XAV8_9FIRM|nr:FAD-dependent oxidoreductase [Acididesulfobacillus acetoxydans]CAA7600446.1 Pyridine nucleotide-disulphide oxidoreductase [Acididesulfobacillus acetoxydans]CEJ06580.1 FAD-dependent pyridine nucleotide-disulfide oxidoreductase [Acididesulfobacillus acetoxydans]
MKKVTVLGGGIAGVEAAIHLRKKNFEVTVISNRDYVYIYPISIWVPTGEKTLQDVSVPLAKLAGKHGFRVIVDEVVSIRAAEGTVVLKTWGDYREFDYLVVALGASKLKPQGAAHTLSICGEPGEAAMLHERLETLVQRGQGQIAIGFGGNPQDQSAVRGGPAFEVMFNIDHFLRRRRLRQSFDLTFFAPMESPGARMGTKAVKKMGQMFETLGISTRFGRKIVRFEPDGVVFEDGSVLASDLTMFIPAGAGQKVLRDSGLPLSTAGFIEIDDYCQVPGFDHIYAIGDSAAMRGPEWKAKQGHLAEVMARNVAHNIAVRESGGQNFLGYEEHVGILCVMDSGNGAAYVERDARHEKMILMPFFGHWLKKSWGVYYKLSKMDKIPRLPGM